MLIRWSPEAAESFEAIYEYLTDDNPKAAQRVALHIYEAASSLANHPSRGRVGRMDGTRELVLAPLPYLIVYRVNQIAVEIVRVVHGAQAWPPLG
jgi:addiction module RelE/StbE family toxin